jgi:apolipoprotein N-acyltransferase
MSGAGAGGGASARAVERTLGTVPVTALAARIAALGGWRRYGVAAALGALAAAAMPPLHLLPALPIAFTGLVWLVDGSGSGRSGARAAFLAGWSFGLGHFVAGLYWIVNGPIVYGLGGLAMVPLIPVITIGLPALLALFPGGACLVARLAALRLLAEGAAARVLLLAAAWVGFEWLRANLLSGFPWNLAGYAWAVSDAMLQLAALTGIYGLGLLTVAAAAMPAALGGGPAAPESPRRRWLWLATATAALALVWAGGAWRLARAGPPDGLAAVPEVMLRVVQPNLRQQDKWKRELRWDNFILHLRLSAAPGRQTITHVIWPETATAFFLDENDEARRLIGQVTAPGGALITGAPRRLSTPGTVGLRNSLLAIDDRGAVVAAYDKFHLVPYGEYVPFKAYLPFAKVVSGAIDYSPGPGPRTLRIPGLPPVSPLICYEVIFPGAVLDRGDRPHWLLNLTNDAWFGTSAGPYQHLAIARVRAIEEGMALVRAANTGISAVVDPYGRVTARLDIGVRGIIDTTLPAPLAPGTVYGKLGDWLVLAMIATVVVTSIFLRPGRLPFTGS